VEIVWEGQRKREEERAKEISLKEFLNDVDPEILARKTESVTDPDILARDTIINFTERHPIELRAAVFDAPTQQQQQHEQNEQQQQTWWWQDDHQNWREEEAAGAAMAKVPPSCAYFNPLCLVS